MFVQIITLKYIDTELYVSHETSFEYLNVKQKRSDCLLNPASAGTECKSDDIEFIIKM